VGEISKAVEMSYTLLTVSELWEYSVTQHDKRDNSGELFSDYINMFLKLKQESNGYPSWEQSEDVKEKYI